MENWNHPCYVEEYFKQNNLDATDVLLVTVYIIDGYDLYKDFYNCVREEDSNNCYMVFSASYENKRWYTPDHERIVGDVIAWSLYPKPFIPHKTLTMDD